MQHPIRSGPPWLAAGAGTRLGRLAAAALSLCLAAFPAANAAAQGGEVAGTVVSAQGQRPLSGAQVTVEGTQRRTVTDAAGRFRLAGLEGSEVSLRVTLIGHQAATRTARVGDTGVRIALSEAAVSIDALVVTGTPAPTERRALGNAVTQIAASEVVETAPVENIQGLLNGRAPGVVVQPATGAVGGGARVRIRGASSFTLSNEPLIYIDGVRVNSAPATGPANQAFGSSSISRLNDLNPEEIESIEVIRGPAASTLYGTEASAGVIQILTKRGSTGQARWNASIKQGRNFLANPEGRFWTNYQVVSGDTVTLDIVELEDERGTPIFRSGHLQEYDLNVSGGSDRYRYFASGGYEDSEGAERSNDLRRYNARMNLQVNPSSRLDLNLGIGYVDGLTNLSAEGGFGGRVWSTVLADPRNLNDRWRRGFHSGTPEQYDALYNFSQGIGRLTGTLQATHRPTGWLTQRLSYGVDFTREDNVIFFPRIDSLVANPTFGSEALGTKEVDNRDVRFRTFDYSATADLDINPSLNSKTSVGAQYYKRRTSFVFAAGDVFPAEGLSTVGSTTTARVNDEGRDEEAGLGVFVQQQLGWRDRLFVTGAVRSDDHSTFGENVNAVLYPKLSGSWVVSEEPFFGVPFVNTLLLRAAYGEAGRQPPNNAAIRTYAPTVGPNESPAITPQNIGNPDLKPERGRELELGFDAGFLDDRLGLELTWYRKVTTDQILDRQIAPSVGFTGIQYFNTGEVVSSGLEVLARARPLERENVGLDLTFSVATNDNEITDLGIDGLTEVPAGSFLFHREGYPVGSFFEQRVVSAQFDAAGRAVNVLCDNGSGGTVACASAPNVFLGRTVPKVEGAFTSTLTLFGNLRLYGMLDFKRGHRKVDGNTRVRCTFFGGRCRENFYPTEFDPRRIAAINSSGTLVDFLIDDASFTKLRELSVAYTIPDRFARRAGASRASISLAGRNLYTWTSYGGLEPEAMFLGGTRGGNHSVWEQTTLPQLAQWVLSLNLSL